MRSDQEFLSLRTLRRAVEQTDKLAPDILNEVYTLCFGESHPPKARPELLVKKWESSTLARAIELVAGLVSRYVQLFHDPRKIPVTHYWKQKQTSILLDQFASQILWEALRRSSLKTAGYNVYEETDADPFLDKPILFLKEEARDGRFAMVKQASGLALIEARFMEKALSSGINLAMLSQEDFHSL